MTQTDGPRESAGERAWRLLAYVVLVVLTAQATVAGAVLLLWRPWDVPVPVGLAVALLIGPACWWGATLARSRLGAAGPGGVWLLIVLLMMYQRREGDLFVRSDLKGLSFLLIGTIGAAVASGSWLPGTSLRGLTRRSSPRGGVAAG